jgi:putative transposase
MGRVGSCFDNADTETFFSSLEWEVLSRNLFRDTVHARAVVIDWCYTFCNRQRRRSAADGLSPVNYEIREHQPKPEAA